MHTQIHRDPTKWELVVLALEDVGGSRRVVDTEDVAVAAHMLAPQLFSWRKHPEQIDLDSVRISLTDARKVKYGMLVTGSIRAGWQLTDSGAAWCASRGTEIRNGAGTKRTVLRFNTRAESRTADREVARLEVTLAYTAWQAGRHVPARDAAAVFRIDAYTPSTSWKRKIDRVARTVANDPILEFVAAMAAIVPMAFPAGPVDDEGGTK